MVDAPRTLKIEYGSFTVGAGTEYEIHNKYTQDGNSEMASFSFDVVISRNTQAAFSSATAELEAAFRLPRQGFTITNGTSVIKNLRDTPGQSNQTFGYNADPNFQKMGEDEDSGLTRKYRCMVSYERPADQPGRAGRRTAAIEVNFEPGRRKVLTVTGRFTSLEGASAYSIYISNSPAYFASLQSSLGGTWETVANSERVTTDDTDRNADFQIVFEQLRFNQAQGVVDHPVLKMVRYSFVQSDPAPGDSPAGGAVRLQQIQATIKAWVDLDQIAGDVAQAIESLWRDTLIPYMTNVIKGTFGVDQVARVDAVVDDEPVDGQISGNLVFLAVAAGGGSTLEYKETTQITNLTGVIGIPAWDPNTDAKHVYQGPSNCTRRRTIVTKVLGIVAAADCQASLPAGGTPAGEGAPSSSGGGGQGDGVGGGGGGAGESVGGGQFYFTTKPDAITTPIRHGKEDTIDATEITFTTQEFFAAPVQGAGTPSVST